MPPCVTLPLKQPASEWASAASSTLSDDGRSIFNPPQSGGDTLIPPAQTSVPTGLTQHSCLPVHLWTVSLPQGQEVLPTSASATSLVTCGH